MTVLWLLAVVAGFSFLLTWQLRRYALARSLMDIPNSRSSHSLPTPRGGGVAIVLSFLAAMPLLVAEGGIGWSMMWGVLGACGGVALIGFIDDHSHIAARWRLLGHFSGAFWGLYWLKGLPGLEVFGFPLELGWFGHVLAAFFLVWLLNLYNFMDGIDGIASVEAICVCLGGALLYLLLGQMERAVLPLLLVAAVLGFVVWNFPFARIFMGDAGSGFLGMTLGLLLLQAAWSNPKLLWSWMILLGVFVVDATWTLLRRFFRGEKIYEAHRSHAYQYASRHLGRHWPVTVAVLVLNLAWLMPIALWVGLGDLDGVLGLILAYLPLLMLAVKYKAGKREFSGPSYPSAEGQGV